MLKMSTHTNGVTERETDGGGGVGAYLQTLTNTHAYTCSHDYTHTYTCNDFTPTSLY